MIRAPSPCTGRGKCYNHFRTRPLQPRSAQPDGDYLEPIQYVDTFVAAPRTRTEIDGAVLLLHIVQPAPRTRTEIRKQPEMSHGQSASPTRTEDSRFPSADRRTFQLRANKQYANIARHNLAALFHTVGREFRIHTPTPALRHAAQCRRRTSAAMLPTITSPRRRRWQTMRHDPPRTSERRPARPENDGRAGQSPKIALSRNYNADLFAIRPES